MDFILMLNVTLHRVNEFFFHESDGNKSFFTSPNEKKTSLHI